MSKYMTISEQLKLIYDRLNDAESKIIFLNRVQYMLDRDVRHFIDMFQELAPIYAKDKNLSPSIYNILADSQLRAQPIILYGCGFVGIHTLGFLDLAGLNVCCFCDGSKDKQGTNLIGVPIEPPSAIIEKYKNANVIVTTVNFKDEIHQNLIKMGVESSRIFTTIPNLSQYFHESFFVPRENEIYIDAGCKNGDTILDFCNWCNKNYKKIYGFEPDQKNAEITKKTVSDHNYNNIKIVEKGVWSTDNVLEFSNDGLAHSHFSEVGALTYSNCNKFGTNEEAFCYFNDDVADSFDTKISVAKIDSIALSDKVTFIKMDIEGSELEALKGGGNTIKQNKPRLAICLYHKIEDIVEIPAYIAQLVPEYKFYIRHHDLSPFETVLYAVIE